QISINQPLDKTFRHRAFQLLNLSSPPSIYRTIYILRKWLPSVLLSSPVAATKNKPVFSAPHIRRSPTQRTLLLCEALSSSVQRLPSSTAV
ncbi:hypothetical protein TMatcc_010704, partial [Talaromyces marneffei ATCC 18224]